MSVLNIPNVFVQGTTINAAPFNTNFSAVQTAVNNVDNSNVGASGFFASQLLPTTLGQATFGGAIGYLHLAPSASTTPLTVSGVAGQSANIFDVTLTSGGTKALAVTATAGGTSSNTIVLGQFAAGGALGAGSSTGDITAARSATAGNVFLGNGTAAQQSFIGASGNVISLIPTASSGTAVTVSANGSLNAASGPIFTGAATATTNTDLSSSRSGTTGVVVWGSTAASNCTADFGINAVGTLTFKNGTGTAFIPLTGGPYTNSSDASLKTNIKPVTDALAAALQLKPVSFNWQESDAPGLGFVAQDVQAIFPDLVKVVDQDGRLGVNYDGIIPVCVAAIQELAAQFTAYVLTHP